MSQLEERARRVAAVRAGSAGASQVTPIGTAEDRSVAAAALFDQCPDGVVLVDVKGRVLAANPAACAMLRMSEVELGRAGRSGIIDPADRDRAEAAGLQEEATGRSHLDLLFRRGDGTRFVAAVNSAAIGDGRSWMLFRDVTERRRTEQALQSLSDLTTDLLDGAPLTDLMAKTVAAARGMLGAAAAWISAASDDGEAILIMAQDSDSPDLPDFSGRRFPIRSVLAGQIAVGRGAVLIDDLSSTESGASALGRSLGLGPALGVPLGHGERYFGSLVVAARPGHPPYGLDDLATARLLARSAAVALGLASVQAELSELAALFEEGPDAVLLTGSSGRLLSANRAARSMFAMTEDQLRAEVPQPQPLEGDSDEVTGPLAPDPDGRQLTMGDVVYRRPDGTVVVGNVASVSRSGALGETRRWTVIRDVTDRRRMEESLRAIMELTMALLAREPTDRILARCAADARRLVRGAAGYASTLADDEELVTTVAEDSPPAYSMLGRSQPRRGTVVGEVIATGRSLIVEDLSAKAGSVQPGTSPALGPALVVPLQHNERCFGVLLVAAERGRPPYGPADLGVVEMFAHSAALALDLSQARATLALVEERERIAKELHDRVIQHLFGTGLGLQAVAGRPPEQMAAGIARSVEALDRIISEIRGTIFDLTGAE